MGDALYEQLGKDHPAIRWRTYAPVGSHRDLLAYLVRRLLENGANSSFVAIAADDTVPVTTLLKRPAAIIGAPDGARHREDPLPGDLYRPERTNSHGIEFGERAALNKLLAEIAASKPDMDKVVDANAEQAGAAVTAARAGFASWSRTPAENRAAMLDNAAGLSGTAPLVLYRLAATGRRQDA